MSETPQYDIIVDTREKNQKLLTLINEQMNPMEATLNVGDFDVNNYLIERKTLDDLKGSVISKRLWGQLDGMNRVRDVSVPVLLVEGTSSFRGFKGKQLKGVLNRVSMLGIQVIQTDNEAHTVHWLKKLRDEPNQLFDQDKKVVQEILLPKSQSLRKGKKAREMTLPQKQRYILEGLPGIGPKSADKLLKETKTVRSAFTRIADGDLTVKSIGKKKAQTIWEVVNAEYEAEGE
jgi:Fanconi anemia group M protein